ncbi:MAG: HAD family phosphatase [Candidatus Altiarchaeota archaeon]
MDVKAVVFDLEGTLVDMFDSHVKAFNEVMARHYNLGFKSQDLLIGYGMHAGDIMRIFLRRNGVDCADCTTLVEEKQGILRSKYAGDLKVLPGARQILDALRKSGFKIGLASSSPGRNVEFMLRNPGLRPYFDAVAVAEDVEKAKPNPAVFLKAAELLGLNPRECVAVEDSVHGVEAAKKAGMMVIGVTTGQGTMEELDAAGADLIVASLESLTAEAVASIGFK